MADYRRSTVLRARYGKPGTGCYQLSVLPHAAICLRACYAMSGRNSGMLLCACYEMPGIVTELGYAASSPLVPSLPARDHVGMVVNIGGGGARTTYGMPGTDAAYGATRVRQFQRYQPEYRPTRLLFDARYFRRVWQYRPMRVLCNVHSTSVAYALLTLYACYKMSGTDAA
eukprot:2111125-Rhodomonas_salina.6